jgi:pimeloyl-ACP methyl ester carboxylesterase
MIAKKIFVSAFAVCIFLQAASQDAKKFVGTWQGKLNVGVELRLVLHVKLQPDGTLSSTLDSPDQNAFDIPTDTTIAKGNELGFEMSKLNVSFTGKLTNDTTIDGTFTQGGDVALVLTRTDVPMKALQRPQTPVAPFPYTSLDVEFDGARTGLHYAGTITIPAGKGPFPAAVMITGSGPQNRDEEILLHKPFAVIADHLARNGYIVLRVDDRGIGKTSGNFQKATSMDFAADVEAALDYLLSRPETDKKRTGLIGHSEGGMIAPIVASRRKDVDFIILLAGIGEKTIDLMIEQNAAILKTAGIDNDAVSLYIPVYRDIVNAIIAAPDSVAARTAADQKLEAWVATANKVAVHQLGLDQEEEREKYIGSMTSAVYTPWFRYFITFDPRPYLEKLSCKVLALNGSRDIQVVSSSNLASIEAALKKSRSKKYNVQEIPGLNHLFQTCNTCNLAEYGQLEQTISPVVLDIVTGWLNKNVK